MSKAKFDQAKAHVGLAKAHLDFTRISAPFTGIMDRLQVRTGSLLSEGDILAALSDNSSMWVYFNVPEAEYLNYMTLRQGAEHESVRLKMANGAVFDQPGKVTTIEADFNNETGNIAFRATFPNPKGLLRHGETGNILMTEEVKGAIIIPQKATFEVLDKKFVYVVGQDGIVHARQVTIKAELQHLYVIGSGIGTNDRILLDGLRKVKENDRIETTEVSPADVLRSLHLYAE
jgi:membrane fusion protein (multidrug efflux system)